MFSLMYAFLVDKYFIFYNALLGLVVLSIFHNKMRHQIISVFEPKLWSNDILFVYPNLPHPNEHYYVEDIVRQYPLIICVPKQIILNMNNVAKLSFLKNFTTDGGAEFIDINGTYEQHFVCEPIARFGKTRHLLIEYVNNPTDGFYLGCVPNVNNKLNVKSISNNFDELKGIEIDSKCWNWVYIGFCIIMYILSQCVGIIAVYYGEKNGFI